MLTPTDIPLLTNCVSALQWLPALVAGAGGRSDGAVKRKPPSCSARRLGGLPGIELEPASTVPRPPLPCCNGKGWNTVFIPPGWTAATAPRTLQSLVGVAGWRSTG